MAASLLAVVATAVGAPTASASVFTGGLDVRPVDERTTHHRLGVAGDGRTNVTLRRRGGETQIVSSDRNGLIDTEPIATGPLVIEGSAGNDTLRVDFSGGDPAPGGLRFDGGDESGGSGDAIVLAGGDFETTTYAFAPQWPGEGHAGTVTLDGTVVEFRDLEPLTNTGTADDVVFSLPVDGNDEAAVLDHNVIINDSFLRLRSANAGFETTGFTAPSGSLTINLGDDNETLEVGVLDDGYDAPITVNGGNGATSLSLGNNATLHGGSYAGGADGNDTVDYSAYTTPMAVNLGLGSSGLNATLGGDQEVPARVASAAGAATLSNYDTVTRTFDISVVVTGITPAQVEGFHIHKQAMGANGPVIVDLEPLAPLVPSGDGFTFTAFNVPIAAEHESALLGGLTYINVHTAAAPDGLIRGQIFSGGNVNLPTGTATGMSTISGVERAIGGPGADGITGSFAANTIDGRGGGDFLLFGPGADTGEGGDGDDILVWSNGDGVDVLDGEANNDTVQVNGSTAGADVFQTHPSATPGRLEFQRLSPGPFTLDIGTTETLTVNGIGGSDMFTSDPLTGVNNLAQINFHGLADGDEAGRATGAAPAFLFRGGDGTDSLSGPAQSTDWSLTSGQGNGTTNGGVTFERLENLDGSIGTDRFLFAEGASVAGTLDGDAGGGDELDYSARTTGVVANLGSTISTLSATLGADQEVPVTGSTATGTATLANYDPATHAFDIVVDVVGIAAADVSGFHLHRSVPGANGPIIVDLMSLGTLTPTMDGFTFAASGVPLPQGDEAALLGGVTYVNVHTPAFPNGAIRGQLFPAVPWSAVPPRVTGAGAVANIEHVSGGSGDDSLVGNSAQNTLAAGPGADTIVPAGGSDLPFGATGDDIAVWNNGDGTNELFIGGDDADVLQVNGAPAAPDVFTVSPFSFAPSSFAIERSSPDPFLIAGETFETLKVNGLGGSDSFSSGDLAPVADVGRVDFHGFDGADSFTFAAGSPVAGMVDGGVGADSLRVNGGGGADQLSVAPVADSRFQVQRMGAPQFSVNAGTTENLTVDGAGGDDVATIRPLGATPVLFDGAGASDTLRFDPGCLGVTTGPGSLTAAGLQPVTHANVEGVEVASAFRILTGAIGVGEGAGSATVEVTRSASGTGSASVTPTATDGSATAGSDYTAPSGALAFGPGETTKTFAVPITNDGDDEPDEAFGVGLASPGPFASVCDPSTSTVTIGDDDEPALAPGPADPGGQTPPGGGPAPPGGTAQPPAQQLALTLRGQPKVSARDGSVTFNVNVPTPGTLSGAGVANVVVSSGGRRTRRLTIVRGSKRAARAGRIGLKLKPTRAGKRLLRQKGRQRVRVTLTLRPRSGARTTLTRSVTLKLTRPRRR